MRYRIEEDLYRRKWNRPAFIPRYNTSWIGGYWMTFDSGCGYSKAFETLEEARNFIRDHKKTLEDNKKREKEMRSIYHKP